MNKKRSLCFFLVIIFIVLLLTGCRAEYSAFEQLPILKNYHVLFSDDFTNEGSGWIIEDSKAVLKGYGSEGFWIIINQENLKSWSVPGMNFKNVQIEVTGQKITGEDNNAYGLICRYQDENNFYHFLISSDGYFSIAKIINGNETILGLQAMSYSSKINLGDHKNRISAICEESTLSLSVNDNLLLSVNDNSLKYGDVGILAANREGINLAILFNDFVVMSLNK